MKTIEQTARELLFEAFNGGDDTAKHDAAIGKVMDKKERSDADWGKVMDAESKISGKFNFPGLKHSVNSIYSKHPHHHVNSDKPAEHAAGIRKELAKHGYEKSSSGKLMGASETYEYYRHPQHPNHRVVVHKSPYTSMGEKHARIDVKVEGDRKVDY